LLLCNQSQSPISPVANPCCNRAIAIENSA
jgi:hypothetical protein